MTIQSSEIDKAKNRKDFLWRTDRNQWHNQRALEMRKKYKGKISELEGNDPWTLLDFILMSGSHWGLAVLLSIYFGDSYYKIAFIGWLLGGFWSCAAGLAIHEAAHQLVLPGRWGSFLAGFIGELPCFLPAYRAFLHYHMPHHSYISIDLGKKNQEEMDRSQKKQPMYDPDLPTQFEAYMFSKNMFTRIGFLILQVLLYAFRPQICCPRTLTPEDFIGIVGQILYIGSGCYVTESYGPLVYLMCASLLGQGLHIASIHFVAEHYSITEDTSFVNDPNQTQDTFSYYGPLNYVLFNGGYHIEHHDFPKIPYRKLPQLKALAPEFYDSLPHHTSYIKVLFRFIYNHPGLWQRVKREYKSD